MAARVFRILVVDDSRDDLGLTARVVRRDGHEVQVADNGQAALEIARRFPRVVVVPLESNSGFGAANNIGMRRALEQGADFVFLLNQDATAASYAAVCANASAASRLRCSRVKPPPSTAASTSG